jgi:hypothetical protein
VSAADPWREPERRRTCQPVRRNSLLAGAEPREYRQGFRRRDKRDILSAAEIYDRMRRQPGSRNGPIGHVGREVLRTLVGLALSGGRDRLLEPAIEYIMRSTRRSKDAVVRALAALKAHGFLDWIRRFTPVDGALGRRGPQVRQTSNAYRLSIPDAARKLLRKTAVPDDHVTAREARASSSASTTRKRTGCWTPATGRGPRSPAARRDRTRYRQAPRVRTRASSDVGRGKESAWSALTWLAKTPTTAPGCSTRQRRPSAETPGLRLKLAHRRHQGGPPGGGRPFRRREGGRGSVARKQAAAGLR